MEEKKGYEREGRKETAEKGLREGGRKRVVMASKKKWLKKSRRRKKELENGLEQTVRYGRFVGKMWKKKEACQQEQRMREVQMDVQEQEQEQKQEQEGKCGHLKKEVWKTQSGRGCGDLLR